MAIKKKPKDCQAEWFCMWLNRMVYVTKEANAIDDEWLCPCGRWIKDDIFHHNNYHRLQPSIYHSTGSSTNGALDMGLKKDWKILYWDNSDKEHTTYIKHCTLGSAIDKLKVARIRAWSIFDEDGLNVRNGGKK